MKEVKRFSASAIGERRDVSKKPGTKISLPNEPLKVGLSSWIIQDGNYGDFKAGSRTQFALEYYSKNLVPLEHHAAREYSIKHIEDDQYRVVGRVVHAHSDWIVLDFGCLAYQCSVRAGEYQVGEWYRGDICLSVDHYYYCEQLSRQTNAPPMIYSWRIEKIELLTAPWVQEESGLKRRDTGNWGWREIAETDAWKDDGGCAEYVFTCSMLDDERRSEFEL